MLALVPNSEQDGKYPEVVFIVNATKTLEQIIKSF